MQIYILIFALNTYISRLVLTFFSENWFENTYASFKLSVYAV